VKKEKKKTQRGFFTYVWKKDWYDGEEFESRVCKRKYFFKYKYTTQSTSGAPEGAIIDAIGYIRNDNTIVFFTDEEKQRNVYLGFGDEEAKKSLQSTDLPDLEADISAQMYNSSPSWFQAAPTPTAVAASTVVQAEPAALQQQQAQTTTEEELQPIDLTKF
jgi:hypothetical protein